MAMKEIRLPFGVKKPILACGADLKGAFAVAKDKKARIFDGFGDLADLDNFTRYEKAVKREAYRLKPAVIACDLHPGYFSTHCAEDLRRSFPDAGLFKVQHHEAHVASAIVDHGINGDVIGVAFDGTGYGADGAVWGGEFFAGNLKRFKRAAYFSYMPMPGGDAAVKEPWRMAVSYLYNSGGRRTGLRFSCDLEKSLDPKKLYAVRQIIDKKINSPLTSSAGRLFDAVGSIVFRQYAVSREAELPIRLEMAAAREWADSYDFDINKDNGVYIINPAKTIRGIVSDLSKDTGEPAISGKFHNTVAEIISEVCVILRKGCKTNKVVLTGGVFQNKFLSERAAYLLGEKGFDAYRHSRVNTNDSGIPMGQIAIANSRFLCV